MMNMRLCFVAVLTATALAVPAGFTFAADKVPIVYSTDLFQPAVDVDDHYDLATLFAMSEFDIRGVIFDMGDEKGRFKLGAPAKGRVGLPNLEQMMHITGRRVPYALGLCNMLTSRTDKALEQPAEFQGGVELLLKVLRESPQPVVLFSVGSCRDVAAAFNREPELLRKKVKAYYPNIGNGPGVVKPDYNTSLDPHSYARIFEMGVPLYWCPCYGQDNYQTFWSGNDRTLISRCTPGVQNYFVYVFSGSRRDPIGFLTSGPHKLPGGRRRMWCTAPFLHAGGRKVYLRGEEDFVALRPEEAAKAGLAEKVVDAFHFVPLRAHVPAETPADNKCSPVCELKPAQPNAWVFQSTDPRFRQITASALTNLLGGLGR